MQTCKSCSVNLESWRKQQFIMTSLEGLKELLMLFTSIETMLWLLSKNTTESHWTVILDTYLILSFPFLKNVAWPVVKFRYHSWYNWVRIEKKQFQSFLHSLPWQDDLWRFNSSLRHLLAQLSNQGPDLGLLDPAAARLVAEEAVVAAEVDLLVAPRKWRWLPKNWMPNWTPMFPKTDQSNRTISLMRKHRR